MTKKGILVEKKTKPQRKHRFDIHYTPGAYSFTVILILKTLWSLTLCVLLSRLTHICSTYCRHSLHSLECDCESNASVLKSYFFLIFILNINL